MRLRLFELIEFLLFELEIFSNLDYSSLRHFDKVDTSKSVSKEIFYHFDGLIKLCKSKCLFGLFDGFGKDGHEFIIITLMVLEVLHEIKVLSQ